MHVAARLNLVTVDMEPVITCAAAIGAISAIEVVTPCIDKEHVLGNHQNQPKHQKQFDHSHHKTETDDI